MLSLNFWSRWLYSIGVVIHQRNGNASDAPGFQRWSYVNCTFLLQTLDCSCNKMKCSVFFVFQRSYSYFWIGMQCLMKHLHPQRVPVPIPDFTKFGDVGKEFCLPLYGWFVISIPETTGNNAWPCRGGHMSSTRSILWASRIKCWLSSHKRMEIGIIGIPFSGIGRS